MLQTLTGKQKSCTKDLISTLQLPKPFKKKKTLNLKKTGLK
jgi:hypothetical protein